MNLPTSVAESVNSISALLILCCAVVIGPSAHAIISVSSSQVRFVGVEQIDYAPGELIIGLVGGSRETLQKLLDSWNAKIVDELPEIHAYLVKLEGPDISAKLYEAKALSYAGLYVEPNYYVHAALTPNDPRWGEQWGFPKVRADLAWDIELCKRSIIVAVIDTGVDYLHGDLAANYLPLGYDWVNDDNDPMDDNAGPIAGHGTGVAGVIGAVTNNAVGVAGLAQVSVMAEKVLDSTGTGTVYTVAQGVIHAVKKGARITNNSYGNNAYPPSDTMKAAFEYAWSQGVLNVAAAGNGGTSTPFYPAAFGEYVISVAGTDKDDTAYVSSKYGDWIELSAPAVDILTTVRGNSYGSFTGTSMSSGFVAGAAALVWSHCGAISAEEVRRRLQETPVDLGAPGRDPYFGYGRIDLFSALNEMPCPVVGGRILEPDRMQLSPLFVMEAVAATVGLFSIVLLGNTRLGSRRKKLKKS